jgi:hypothetical protein
VRITAKVNVFDQHVRGEQQVLGRAAGAENGAIIADSYHDGTAAGLRGRHFPNAFDPLQFAPTLLPALFPALDHVHAI